LIALYPLWRAFRASVTHISCSTEKVKEVNLSNLTFEVEDTSCDDLAKDEAIGVYVKDTASDRGWFFPKWRNQRTLLFRYDPGRWNNPLPAITRLSQSTILISIPEVSSIDYQSRKWANMSVNYQMGQVDYPAAPK
jgi:hypothetical protein